MIPPADVDPCERELTGMTVGIVGLRSGTVFVNVAHASLVNGQCPCGTDCHENHDKPTDGRQSLMDALGAAGYHTMGIGKCHFLPDPRASRGFAGRLRQGWDELYPPTNVSLPQRISWRQRLFRQTQHARRLRPRPPCSA